MRTRVRNAVKDLDSSAYYWTNDEVDAAIVAALGELADAAPDVGTKTFSGDGETRAFDCSGEARYLYALAVEHPVGEDPPKLVAFREPTKGTVIVRGDPPAAGTDDVKVYYARGYDSAAATWLVPADDEQAIEVGAAAKLVAGGARYAAGRLNATIQTPRYLRQLAELWDSEYRRRLSAARVRQVGPQWWTSWRIDGE
jgi:hypothetical protein